MDTSISLTWSLQDTNDFIEFEIKCVSQHQFTRLLVDNQTFSAHMNGLLPSTPYNCCVSATFYDHKTQSCTSLRTGMLITQKASTNANTVGGVLGFIIIILLALLVVAILALIYPSVIQPKARKSKTFSR